MNKLLIESINNLKSKEDFIRFMELLILDLKNNPSEWTNQSLQSYLEAIASWTEDMDGYYQNNNLSVPREITWNVLANILMAAKMYE
jgi:hypothetical protein